MWLRVKVIGVSVHTADVAGWHKEQMLKGTTLKEK